MKHNIKVTIGLCVRNNEATIRQAIDSILNQDFPHELMESIVVDGCSKDRTLDIVKNRIKNSRIKSRIFREKRGLGYARQIVIDNARSEYIIWVDGDMLLSRDFVRKQVLFMERNPRVGIAKGKYGMQRRNNLVATLEDIEFALTFRCEGETNLSSLGTSGCIYRVEAIRQVGGFDQSIKEAGEDTDVEHRIKLAGWSLCITSAVFYERRRDAWKSLWNEYFWHGTGASYVFRKNRRVINIYKMLPPVALIVELLRVPLAYRLTRRNIAFLLPFHYVFKRIAWFMGFMCARSRDGVAS
jgi:glycosyltransferase involved in cell wall biosynthesis